MPQTMTMSARIDPALKTKGDKILSSIGLSSSNLISMAYSQLVLRHELPFGGKVPMIAALPSIDSMTQEQLDYEIGKGYEAAKAGKVRPMKEVHAEIRAKYGL